LSDDERLLVFEANMDAALRRLFRRSSEAAAVVDMPFDELLTNEQDGLDGEPGDYEMRQRAVGVRSFLRYLTCEIGKGAALLAIMKRLFAAGRAMGVAPFNQLTMTEAGLMFGETKAAHSWRCKLLSGKLKLAGMNGVQLPGQKSPDASAVYAKVAQGNGNRKKKRRRLRK
jgi:hypothetical protein